MSCRVLGRKVEQMVLRELVMHARAAGIRALRGTYRPTAKNSMVSEHFSKLGFVKVDEAADGTTVWSMSTSVEIPCPEMRVRRSGFDLLHSSV
jgi:predicted enzyme involved in methoxymalonyl-ACP biosynthesis